MIIFACDLDNTLLSSKQRFDDDICVEIIDDKKNSFISRQAYSLLISLIDKVTFIPITTRSIEQYKRIQLNISVPYAVMCHGGKLLEDNLYFNQCWQENTDLLIKNSKTELDKAFKILINDDDCEKTRWVNETFVFAKSNNPEETANYLNSTLDLSLINVSYYGKKLYIFPKELDKGMAIDRLKKLLNPSLIIGAGDSLMDIDMLNKADIAYTPTASLINVISAKNTVLLSDKLDFTYDMLKSIDKYISDLV